ncbi:MAG: beta-Ala-His dipeptidase [Candidatus Lokiarchaeota archaeon]|nr:beta-Ala-His dipeptidase [Candidatus Lokiarchaeota archaeon]
MRKNEYLRNPEIFWIYFEKICTIPRCSGNEKGIREFIISEAKKFNFPHRIDNVGNLLVDINKQHPQGDIKKLVLQSHLDMVCEKNENSSHDFSKDPISIIYVEDEREQWIKAEGTTLGADNGVGIAYSLSIMKLIYEGVVKIKNLSLSLLFTVNEETGLIGALEIDKSMLKADYLINLDSESDNKYIIGCAGGINTSATLEYEKSELIDEIFLNNNTSYEIFVSGLIGGHSGEDINKGRINAIKLISRFLSKLIHLDVRIVSINGGNRSNAIPREAKSLLFVNNKDLKEFSKLTSELSNNFTSKLLSKEPRLEIKVNQIDVLEKYLLPKTTFLSIIQLLEFIPDGPQSWLDNDNSSVHTSTNLASIKARDGKIQIVTSQRSLEEHSKENITQNIRKSFENSGLKFNITYYSEYPGWEPDYRSKLLAIAVKTYKKIFSQDVKISTIHGGLECGILKKQFPEIDMISLGPNIIGAHSPDEQLNIKSVDKIWNLLLKLFEECSKK